MTAENAALEELEALLASADEDQRRLAVLAAARHPVAVSRYFLLRALGDESWRVRKEGVETLVSLDPDGTCAEELVEMLRSEDNAGLRNAAAEALIRTGSASLPALHRHLGDADHDVRKFVIDIIGSIADPASVDLLAAALDDSDPNVAAAAAENLGKIGGAEAAAPLVACLAKDDPWLRFSVLEALAEVGMPVPLEALVPLVNEPVLRKGVYDCLGTVGGIESVPVLMEGLREKGLKSREAAVIALARVRERLSAEGDASVAATLSTLRGTGVAELLLPLLSAPEFSTRQAAIRLCSLIADDNSVPGLLRGCRDDRLRHECILAFRSVGIAPLASMLQRFGATEDDEERALIATLAGEIGAEEGEGLILAALDDPAPAVRAAAAASAGKTCGAGAVGKLVALLGDYDYDVRAEALEALCRVAATERVAVTVVALALAASPESEKRRDAASLLAAAGDADRLSLLVKDEEAEVRREAVAALASLRDPSSSGILTMALVDEDPDVRLLAISALGDLGGDEALAPLMVALSDDDPWVKSAVLRALGKVGATALPAILATARTSDGMVLLAALEAAAAVGGDEARELIPRALDNGDDEVVRGAVEILSTMGDWWVESNIVRLMTHPAWGVRSAFVRALGDLWGEKGVRVLLQALEAERDDMVREQIRDVLSRIS